jgi:hypothetical protein
MAFKFKDLMINVTSGGGPDTPICTVDTVRPAEAAYAITCTVDTVDPAGQAITCTVDTVHGAPYGLRRRGTGQGICTLDTVRPDALMTVTTVTTVTTLLAAAPGGSTTSLAQLKSQLQQALADVEQRERQQEEAQALPATIEEADDLERRLEGALEELRDHRRTLEKGGSKGAKKTGAKPGRPAKPKK